MTSSLTELRPPPTYPTPTDPIRTQPSSGWYRPRRPASRPGPHGSPRLGCGGHHQRAGRGRQLRTYDGSRCGDRASHRPRHHGRLLREPRRARALRDQHPDLAAAPAHSDGPDGAVVPVSTYRSTARYDVDPGRFGQAAAGSAAAARTCRVSTARAVEPGATLAVGDNFARTSPSPTWAPRAGAGDGGGALTIAVASPPAQSRPSGDQGGEEQRRPQVRRRTNGPCSRTSST